MSADGGDSDYFNWFIIYVRDILISGRCDGELNDCLYKYLKLMYGTFSKMPKSIEKPEYIKEKLGLFQKSPVLALCMDKVEDLARNLVFNVTGDVIWISKSKADRRATFVLSEEHYFIATNPDRQHPSHMDHKQKSPFVYREDGINNTVTIYNSKKVKILTFTQFQKVKISKNYVFISVKKNIKTGILETLEKTYQRIHEEWDAFLQVTKRFSLEIDLVYYN
jgi:hypothetical protein